MSNLGEIKKDLKPYKPNIFLAKPNKTIIAKLAEAYDVEIEYNFGGINEVNLSVPLYVNLDHKLTKNAHIDLLYGHYLLKVDNIWYIINGTPKEGGDKETITIHGIMLPYELGDKQIFAYKPEESINAQRAFSDVLEGSAELGLEATSWKVGYIDADFNTMYRSFDITEKSVLDTLNEFAETYDGILQYDTNNKTVSLVKADSIGKNKGLTIKHGKYLKSINEEPDFDVVCTRLYPFGKDNLTINGSNPTGTGYIEDFSYYMYPYKEEILENDEYKVITHSKYMSDSLCHSLIKYSAKIEEQTPNFQSLLENLNTLQEELLDLSTDLTSEKEKLQILYDQLDAAQAKNMMIDQSTGLWNGALDLYDYEDIDDIKGKIHNQQNIVDAKQIEVNAKQDEIDLVVSQMNDLKSEISIENNFTPELIEERKFFIHEQKWSNEYIFDTKELLERGKKELKKVNQPRIKYSINIVDFLKSVECQRDWQKLQLGDIVNIQYSELGINIKAKIITINHSPEENNIEITIANTDDLTDGFIKIQDLIKQTTSTSSIVDISKTKWNMGEDAKGKVEQLIDSKIDATKNAIEAGVNENITMDRRGMTFRDPDDPNNYLRILHNVLAFTNDGGNTFKHAITPWGLVSEYLYGKIITGVNLIIGDKDGILEVLGNKMLITDHLDRIVMRMGLYGNFDDNNPELPTTFDNDKFGIELYRYKDKTEEILNTITMDKDDGFKIVKYKDGTDFQTAWLDVTGTMWLEEVVAKRLKIINSKDETVLDVDDLNLNLSLLDKIILDDIIISSEKVALMNEWISIRQKHATLIQQATKYATDVYGDREASYHQLDIMLDNLNDKKSNLISSYNALETKLNIVFADMETSTSISADLSLTREEFYNLFKNYRDNYELVRNALEDFLEASSLQLGRYYNNVIMDAQDGITVYRTNSSSGDKDVMTRLNATEGISISRKENDNWIKKFFVDLDGILHAEDLIAKRLILVDGDDKLILDAHSKFLDLNAFDYINGTIKAENIATKILTAEDGFINELTVNHLKTINIWAEQSSTRNYIDIKDNYAKWVTGTVTGSPVQATSSRGEPLFWMDADRTALTIETTPYPCMVNQYDETTKLEISFDADNPDNIPFIRFGVGAGAGNTNPNPSDFDLSDAQGVIRRTRTELIFEFQGESGVGRRGIDAKQDGLDLFANKGTINATGDNIKLTLSDGSNIEILKGAEIKIVHRTGSNITFANNGDININAIGNVNINGTQIHLN